MEGTGHRYERFIRTHERHRTMKEVRRAAGQAKDFNEFKEWASTEVEYSRNSKDTSKKEFDNSIKGD